MSNRSSNSKNRKRESKSYPLKCFFFIATEDSKITPKYLEDIFNACKISWEYIKIIPSVDGNSSPSGVIKELKKQTKGRIVDEHDELWILVDRDRWHPQQLSTLVNESIKIKAKIADSNPCFEVWLLLHSDRSDIVSIVSSCENGDHCCERIRELFGINWKNIKDGDSKVPEMHLQFPIEKAIEIAIPKARQCDTSQDSNLIDTKGSRIYRLIESILRAKAHNTY